jgi:hypothetical protein
VKQLVLNHISGRYPGEEILTEAVSVFPGADLDRFAVEHRPRFEAAAEREDVQPPQRTDGLGTAIHDLGQRSIAQQIVLSTA